MARREGAKGRPSPNRNGGPTKLYIGQIQHNLDNEMKMRPKLIRLFHFHKGSTVVEPPWFTSFPCCEEDFIAGRNGIHIRNAAGCWVAQRKDKVVWCIWAVWVKLQVVTRIVPIDAFLAQHCRSRFSAIRVSPRSLSQPPRPNQARFDEEGTLKIATRVNEANAGSRLEAKKTALSKRAGRDSLINSAIAPRSGASHNFKIFNGLKEEWLEPGLNRRPQPFQGCALPTELSNRPPVI